MAPLTPFRFAGITFLAVVLAVSTSRVASAQDDLQDDLPSLDVTEAPSIRIENMGLEDGLAQGTIYEMIQDNRGFIWFGTQSGLHRYDGHEFTVYEPVPFDTTSITHGWTWGVSESSDGSIWAATIESLSRLDPATGKFQNFVHDPADSTSLLGGWVFDSIELSDGSFWVGTGDGLSRMDDARNGVFENYEHIHADSTTFAGEAYFLREGPDGNLWVSTVDGLVRVEPETREMTDYFRTGDHRGPRSPQAVMQGTADADDPYVFWYGMGRGLMRFDSRSGDREVWVPYPNDPPYTDRNHILNVENDPNAPEVLWLGTSGGGLLRFDTRLETFTFYEHDPQDPNSLASNMANTVFADRSGMMWVGYGNKGLGKFNPTSVSIAHLRHDPDAPDRGGLPQGNIWAMLETGRYLWAGISSDAGDHMLARYDLATGAVDALTADRDNPSTFWPSSVQSLLMGSDGLLWVGSAGLSACDPSTLQCRRIPRAESREDSTRLSPRAAHALFESEHEPGVIWVGSTPGGLQRYDVRSGQMTRYPLGDEAPAGPWAVAHIMEGSDGAIWVGSWDSGLARFDRETETFERFSYDASDTTGVGGNHMEIVLERTAEPGVLWLGTLGSGLDRFDMETRTVRHFGPDEGLTNTTIYGILEDDEGMLWISTNAGIFSFDAENEVFRNYGMDDGLRELEFMQNAFTNGRGGMLYFGDVSGITAFAPSRLDVNKSAPDVAFTALRVDGQLLRADSDLLEGSLADSAAIRVPYAQNSFSVDFVGLHFSNPTKNKYSYLLDGYDDEWSEPSFQRTAAYTNLPPGEFTLRVRSANPDGVWSESAASLDVAVLPPWYRTTWAYILFAVLLGGAIFGADRYQRRKVVRRERARAELQEIELRAEAAESEAKALAAENQRKKNIERLSDIGQEITASLDFETIFDRVYVHINELTDAPIFGVGVWRADANLIDYRLAIEEGKKYEPYTRDASDKNQFPVWCIEHKEAVFINDVENEYSKYIDHYDEEGAKLEDGTVSRRPQSLIYLPLISKDQVLGVITVQSFEKNAYTQNDLNLLKTMAAYSSVAMDNASAYRKLNGTIDELRQMQQQLVQQEKMASLGQLTAGIAHEIKNPLNFVTNFADLNSEMATELREILVGGDAASIAAKHGEIEDLIASLQMNAKQIAKHGRRADSIVRGMMEHARPGDAEHFEVGVNGFVDEYVNLAWHGYRARYPDLQVNIEREFDDSVGNASIAPQEMGRVLINLIGNALDVVREREDGALSIKTVRRNGEVEIRVADNGPGVPTDLRAKIFEPFFTTKTTGEGTGLGLSMSHDIVTKGHGGQLRIEDTPGGGATFVVSIPG